MDLNHSRAPACGAALVRPLEMLTRCAWFYVSCTVILSNPFQFEGFWRCNSFSMACVQAVVRSNFGQAQGGWELLQLLSRVLLL